MKSSVCLNGTDLLAFVNRQAVSSYVITGFPPRGGGGSPSEAVLPNEIWSENNRKISITVDFVPSLKNNLEESQCIISSVRAARPWL